MLIVAALTAFLFGVKLESTAPATGIAIAPSAITIRASRSGIIHRSNSPKIEPNADRTIEAGSELAHLRPFGDPVSSKGAPVSLPSDGSSWQILEIHFADGQRIQEGDPIATVCPMPAEGGFAQRAIRLDIDERHFGPVRTGQDVRIYSVMYPHRNHGVAKGVIERVEPMGSEGANGSRRFHAWVNVTDNPFPLAIGSSVRAEIVTGKKPTFQIILEH